MSIGQEDLKETLDRLDKAEAGSLKPDERNVLNGINKTSLARNNEFKKYFENYFNNRRVYIKELGNSFQFNDFIKGLTIRKNPGSKLPTLFFNGKEIKVGRNSQLVALLQAYCIIVGKKGLGKWNIDGTLGDYTATALVGKHTNIVGDQVIYGPNYKDIEKGAGMQAEIKKQRDINIKTTKEGIENFGKKILSVIPVVKRWMDKKNVTIKVVPSKTKGYALAIKLGDETVNIGERACLNENLKFNGVKFRQKVGGVVVKYALDEISNRLENHKTPSGKYRMHNGIEEALRKTHKKLEDDSSFVDGGSLIDARIRDLYNKGKNKDS